MLWQRSSCHCSEAAALGLISPLDIKGPLCAQNNTGPLAGFLYAVGSTVTFHQPDTACVNNNTPVDIRADSNGNIICGASSTPWALNTDYIIQGRVCACNAEFQLPVPPGTSNRTCSSCLTPWDAAACSCKVSS
jgi:hypothetical protein